MRQVKLLVKEEPMIETIINGVELKLQSAPQLFSPSHPDAGTMAMLSVVDIQPEDKVLDLGCGYGLVGIYAAKVVGESNVVMCDIEPLAVDIARRNAKNNGLPNLQVVHSDAFTQITANDFTLVLCNPPYHVDFAVPKRIIEGAFKHLAIGGRLAMVVKRRTWYENKMRAVFGGVRVVDKDGYLVMIAEKRQATRPPKATKGTTRKHAKKVSAVQMRRNDRSIGEGKSQQ